MSTDELIAIVGDGLDTLQDSVIVTDALLDLPGPRILFVNHAFERIFEYTSADVLGHSPRMFQGPDTDRAVLDELRRCLKEGRTFLGQTYNYRRSGERFMLQWTVSPIRNPSGQISHFVACQRDLGQTRRMAEALFQRSQVVQDLVEMSIREGQTLARAFEIRSRELLSTCGLSPREQEIARLVLRGGHSKEIAHDLGISPNTVRNHLTSIFRKVGVNSVRELMARLFGDG